MSEKSDVVILLSGGIDSMACIPFIKTKVLMFLPFSVTMVNYL